MIMADLKEELERSYLADTMKERDRYRDALIEIRDVARISEGVEWYVMIAEKALGETN
jgi:hypothetical protein